MLSLDEVIRALPVKRDREFRGNAEIRGRLNNMATWMRLWRGADGVLKQTLRPMIEREVDYIERRVSTSVAPDAVHLS